ncbi:TonB-dependent receptor [Joostella atrarenae]|uniref:TonB-dependent receptor n=1 Tax=Joostella atrarenae TaxID=679257 RepID=A0ABS9IZQ8_9FLAO|nr:TonB-dependent receptor [Joostella atrarenae]MCF8713652.1 TonB-dependent receptor [Joostella atrarenae]
MKYLLCLFLLTSLSVFSQDYIIEGVVTGESITPLSGVNVSVLNSRIGTTTDSEGHFTLAFEAEGTYQIVFSHMGYQAIKREVSFTETQSKTINIVLKEDNYSLDEVVIVTESRVPESLSEVPSTVNVISSEDIFEQSVIDDNLPNILAYKVPGLSPSEESQNAISTKLRGRDPLVLIDGIPQTSPLRDGSRDLRTISSQVLERVEVINGASATYGNGATGGVINYITKKPLMKDGTKFMLNTKGSFNLVNVDETLGFSVNPSLFVKTNDFDMVLSGEYGETGVQRSADGEVIGPLYGLGETTSTNFFGKLGYQVADKHRLEFMANTYHSEQDSKYITQGGTYGGEPAIGVIGDSDIKGGTPKNINLYFKYLGEDIFWNTDLNATAYYNDSDNVFEGYNKILATNQGLRFNFNTNVSVSQNANLSLTYGLDLLDDFTVQKGLDESLVTPEIDLESVAPYAQAKLVFSSGFVVKGGIRYEDLNVNIGEYPFEGELLDGKSFNDHALVFNAGLKYNKWKPLKPFVSFSQGYTIGDIGLALRNGLSVNDFKVDPGITNNYEIGFDGDLGIFNYQVAGYYSTSEKGVRFIEVSPGTYETSIQPQKIYGVEAIVSAPIGDKLTLSTSVGYVDGKEDSDNDSSYESELYNAIVPPLKLTGSVNYMILDNWSVLLQALHIGSRDVFSDDELGQYGKNPITGYTLLDLYTGYTMDKVKFTMGINNLFNADYFPVNSEVRGTGPYYQKGRGMTLTLGAVLTID